MPLLYERLRTHLLDEIRSGRLRPGDRIPSELALADQFNVSRITSKKALETLERDGLIVRFRGKGSFVADVQATAPPPTAHDAGGVATGETTLAASSVGYVFPDMSDAFGVRLFDAIEERCAGNGLNLLVKRSRGRRDIEVDAIARFVQAGVKGLIVFPVHGEFYNDQLLRIVIDGFPVVLVDRYLKGIAVTSIGTDNHAAARALAGNLLAQGRTRLAFVSPPPNRTSSIEDRRRGFGASLREHQLPFDRANLLMSLVSTLPGEAPDAIDSDKRSIHEFLDGHPEVDGFVACEHPLALLLEQALTERGREDLLPYVACFDAPQSLIEQPRFTHIQQDERTIGRAAVDALLDPGASSPVSWRVDVAFRLIERQPAPMAVQAAVS